MKIFNKKRVASIALAGVLALSATVPALAAQPGDTTLTAKYQDPTLNVTLSATSAEAIINPYGLPYNIEGATIKDQYIVTKKPLYIVNKSEVALRTVADFEVTVAQNRSITWDDTLTAATAATQESKYIVVTLEAFESDLTGETAADASAVNTRFAALKTADAAMIVKPNASGTACNSDDPTTSGGNSTGTVTGKKGKLILREGNAEGAAQKGSIGFFRLSGFVGQKAAWEADDKFTAVVTWTFIPDTYVQQAGSIAFANNVTSVANGSSVVATVTPELPNRVTVKTVEWESSAPANATVTPDATDPLKATVTGRTGSSVADIIAYVTASDGITYVARKTINIS